MCEIQTDITEGTIVRHFKGNKYLVLGFATHSETREDLVIYKELYGKGNIWARPLGMFMENAPVGPENITGQTFRFQAYEPVSKV